MREIIAQFNGFDYIILAIVLLSLLIGLWRGFIREMISLIIWVAALVIAIALTHVVAERLQPYLHPAWVAEFVSFLLLLIVVLLVGKIVGRLLTTAAGYGGLGLVNHFLGGVLGLVRGIIISVLIVFVISHTAWDQSRWFQGSQFGSRLLQMTHWSYQQVTAYQEGSGATSASKSSIMVKKSKSSQKK